MTDENSHSDSTDPDKYVRKDVSDLRVEFGRIQANLDHQKNDSVTREEFANWKLEFANWKLDSLKWIVQLVMPVFAVLVGFTLSKFLG